MNERREMFDVVMSETELDNWNYLQLFWSESWMMKYMLGLDGRYGPQKRAPMECERNPGENDK